MPAPSIRLDPDPATQPLASPLEAAAVAHPNIALVKYWGKRDAALNLPATGSLSLTLDSLRTQTRVRFDPTLSADRLRLDGAEDPAALARVSACLDVLRAETGCSLRAEVETDNNFPTAAGLASSASGFAALVLAASRALGLPLDPASLSRRARRGSGSAARSIFGGIVEMHAGTRSDGLDAVAERLVSPAAWPLQVVIAVITPARKATPSGAGMQRSAATSPFYPAWVTGAEADLAAAREAVRERDFARLAEVSEHSCLKMHAVMLASRPPLIYWSDVTLACLQRVRELREVEGHQVFFTVDAGPQVKAVCLPADLAAVRAALAAVPGVVQVLHSGLGGGARLVGPGEAD